jgi:hypothetical protein
MYGTHRVACEDTVVEEQEQGKSRGRVVIKRERSGSGRKAGGCSVRQKQRGDGGYHRLDGQSRRQEGDVRRAYSNSAKSSLDLVKSREMRVTTHISHHTWPQHRASCSSPSYSNKDETPRPIQGILPDRQWSAKKGKVK